MFYAICNTFWHLAQKKILAPKKIKCVFFSSAAMFFFTIFFFILSDLLLPVASMLIHVRAFVLFACVGIREVLPNRNISQNISHSESFGVFFVCNGFLLLFYFGKDTDVCSFDVPLSTYSDLCFSAEKLLLSRCFDGIEYQNNVHLSANCFNIHFFCMNS